MITTRPVMRKFVLGRPGSVQCQLGDAPDRATFCPVRPLTDLVSVGQVVIAL